MAASVRDIWQRGEVRKVASTPAKSSAGCASTSGLLPPSMQRSTVDTSGLCAP